MKITAPVNSVEDALAVGKAGADEIYFGVVPKGYSYLVQINRRDMEGQNLEGLQQIDEIVKACGHMPAFLTMNAPTFTEAQLEELLALAKGAVERGVAAFIVADTGFMTLLLAEVPGAKVHVSSLASLTNSEAVRMFVEMGATRIILPRHLSAASIRQIVEKNPEVEHEVFMLHDGCTYEEGHCSTSHAAGAFCLTSWQVDEEHKNAPHVLLHKRAVEAYTGMAPLPGVSVCDTCPLPEIKAENDPDPCTTCPLPGLQKRGMAAPQYTGPCGLCAVPFLPPSVSLKICGRGDPTDHKVESVRMLRAVLDRHEAGKDANAVREFAESLRPAVCNQGGYACYYPETRRDRDVVRLPVLGGVGGGGRLIVVPEAKP